MNWNPKYLAGSYNIVIESFMNIVKYLGFWEGFRRFIKFVLRFILGFLHRFKSVNGFSLVRTAVYRIHIFRVPGFFRRRLLGASMWRLVCCADGHLLDTIKQIFSAWFCILGISAGDYGTACVQACVGYSVVRTAMYRIL